MTIAWVFPGQGSQKLGMANSLQDLPGSRERFELASQILGRDLWKICSGEVAPNEEIYDLNDPANRRFIKQTENYVNDKLKDNPVGKVEWVDIPSVQQQKLKED